MNSGLSADEVSLRRWLAAIAFLLIAAPIAHYAFKSGNTPREGWMKLTFERALQERDLPKPAKQLGEIISENQKEYRANARNWSLVYFGSIFGSAVCSGLAGLILRLDAADFMLTPELDAQIAEAARILRGARSAIALTGAGLSVASGIPTFRGVGGLWTRYGEPPLDGYQRFRAST